LNPQSSAASSSVRARAREGDGGIDNDERTSPQKSETEPASNNGIGWNGREFTGLTERQRSHWQGMFEFSIPDQIDRAAAWLQANPDKAPRSPDTPHAFLVRWLLREVRTPTKPASGN